MLLVLNVYIRSACYVISYLCRLIAAVFLTCIHPFYNIGIIALLW